jgi:HEAT repeat protein
VATLQKVLAGEKTSLELRKGIVEVLARFGKDAAPAVPLLGKLLTDDGSPVELRAAAVAALEQLGPDAKAAVPALKKAAKDRDKFVRSMALNTFAKIGKELGPDVKDVVVLLTQGTDDPLLEVRLAAIETLGNLGAELLGGDAPAVRERLRKLSDSVEKEIAEAAQNALKKLEP